MIEINGMIKLNDSERAEAIAAIESLEKTLDRLTSESRKGLLNEASMVDEMTDRWIPASERLPEEGEERGKGVEE